VTYGERKQEVKDYQKQRTRERLNDEKQVRRNVRQERAMGQVPITDIRPHPDNPNYFLQKLDREMRIKDEDDNHYTSAIRFYPIIPQPQAVNPFQVAYNNALMEGNHG
jgi:hypothetical protein